MDKEHPEALDNEPTCKSCGVPLCELELDLGLDRCEKCIDRQYRDAKDDAAGMRYQELKDEGHISYHRIYRDEN